ncbi:MAG: glycoside hydrolase family 5 protein [Candidatus Anammoxibacter sp.]
MTLRRATVLPVPTNNQAGFIDQLIEWAKLNNMYLILDMHVSQPGVLQSNNGTEKFWTSSANKTLLRNLWKAIATKYVNEPTIAGFDLLNEPSPPEVTDWETFAQQIIDDIRAVDTNHLIIIEYVNAIVTESGSFGDLSLDSAQVSVTDNNLMYDFHIYVPMSNHQDTNVWRLCGGTETLFVSLIFWTER